MKIHVHDNNDPSPEKHNCLSDEVLDPGKILTLHMHPGPCRICPKGHCHGGTINFLLIDGDLFVVLEGIRPPSQITVDETKPHAPVGH